MKTLILRSNGYIIRTEKILLGMSLALMVILLSGGVFFRYVLNDPIVWGESIAKMLILWMTFIGASLSFAEKNHIQVDSLIDYLPPYIRKKVKFITEIMTISIIGYMGYLGFVYFETTLSSTSPILGISIGFFSFAMPVMFMFSTIHILINFLVLDQDTSEVEKCYLQ